MSKSIIHNGANQTPTRQILHSGVWKAVQQSILHGGVWDTGATFAAVYSGSQHPADYSMLASGSSGIKSSWWKFEVPGNPIGFKVHIVDRYVSGNAYRPEFKAMVGAAASPLVDTIANAWYPVGGNVVSASGWNKATWGGAQSVLAKDSASSVWGNSGQDEVVSDFIPISNLIQQPNGNSYAVLCVEQMTASAPYIQWGGYLARNYLTPLANEDGVANDTYWHDIYTNSLSTTAQAVTNAPLAGPPIPSTSAGGQGICAWLEPVYANPVRSFLSTGDSTFSCAYAYKNYAGWIGSAVRSFNDPNSGRVVTYKHCGASGSSLYKYLQFFNQELDNCKYSDVIIQGWSQNDWQAGANANLWISTVTAAVNRCKALGIRVFLADGYLISTNQSEPFTRVFNAINALCDGVNVIKINSWELITDDSAYTGIPHTNYNGGDNVHASLAGQSVLKSRLKELISATM